MDSKRNERVQGTSTDKANTRLASMGHPKKKSSLTQEREVSRKESPVLLVAQFVSKEDLESHQPVEYVCDSSDELYSKKPDDRPSFWLKNEATVPQSVVNLCKYWSMNFIEDSFLRSKTYSVFCDVLDNCLDVSGSPYWTILQLLAYDPYSAVTKTELDKYFSWLIDGFQSYLPTCLPKPQPPSNEIKLAAFLVAFRQKQKRVREMIIDTFDLETNSEIYIPLIKNEIEMKRYDVAFPAVTRLKLQSHLTPTEILPVLLADNFETMSEYVDGNKTLLEQLVIFLDLFCVSKKQAKPLIETLNIPQDLKKRLKCGFVRKVLGEYVVKFNVSGKCNPNHILMKRYDTLFSVLKKKYVKGIIDDKLFDMIVKRNGKSCVEFQRKLVFGMAIGHEDVIGAARYAAEFQLPLNELPKNVKKAVERRDYERDSSNDECSETERRAPLTVTVPRLRERKKAKPQRKQGGRRAKASKSKPAPVSKACWLKKWITVPKDTVKMTEKWLKVLEKAFKDGNKTKFDECLAICLAESNSIWWTTLHLMASSADYAKTNCGFTLVLVKLFPIWAKVYFGVAQQPISKDIRKAAFLVAFHQLNKTIFDTIFVMFDLSKNSEIYVPLIKEEIRTKSYNIAARAVTLLKLQSCFVTEDILFPLFLQDKYEAVNSYVADDKKQQQELVRFLDSFCIRNSTSELSVLAGQYRLPDVKRLRSDTMSVAVKRYVKKFNVPQEYWPNTKRISDMETLRFILLKKYDEVMISNENFDDFVIEIVGDSLDLKVKLVCGMANYEDAKGAAYFADKFELPIERLSNSVVSELALGEYDRELSDCPPPSHDPFPSGLPRYIPKGMSIRTVYEADCFQKRMESILQKRFPVVAIDCEWKPSFNSDPLKLSLLQVATTDTKDNILVMDLLAMEPRLQDRHWVNFRDLLANESILKLGYTFNKDFQILSKASPILKDVSKVTKNFLDMSTLMNNVLNEHPNMFPYYDGMMPKTRGLDSFVRLCFGQSLDKIQQMSNWNRRPLNFYQLVYAGIDAYCLIEMYQVLVTRARKLGINLLAFYSKKDAKKK